MGRSTQMNPNERTTFTAWITRYALTKGVFSIKVEDCYDTTMVQDVGNTCSYYHGKDWHKTRKEAVKRANEMRDKKLASLKKSIERLKKLKFGD